MKITNILMAGLLMVSAGSAMAQAPAGAPAGANGICKDGTYSMSATKSGACGGHKGVQTWYSSAPAKATAPAAAAAAKPAPAAAVAAKPSPAAAPAPAPAAAAKPAAPMTMPMPMPAKAAPAPAAAAAKAGPLSEKVAAPGGGPGMVWVNTESKVYHCTGSAYYGKTKAGKYMSEADAKASGARPNANKPCSK